MNNVKITVGVIFAAVCAYTTLLFYAYPLAEPNRNTCSYSSLNRILAWSSGCFYTAYFLRSSSPQQLDFEHEKLTIFHKRGGAAKHIRWYRSVFYRKFNGHFKLSSLELLKVHQEYIKVSPNSISEVVSLLKYLTLNNSPDIAQQWLNDYCRIYILPNNPYVLSSLTVIMNRVDVSLSLTECKRHQKVS
jgi:hypothetical protein